MKIHPIKHGILEKKILGNQFLPVQIFNSHAIMKFCAFVRSFKIVYECGHDVRLDTMKVSLYRWYEGIVNP